MSYIYFAMLPMGVEECRHQIFYLSSYYFLADFNLSLTHSISLLFYS